MRGDNNKKEGMMKTTKRGYPGKVIDWKLVIALIRPQSRKAMQSSYALHLNRDSRRFFCGYDPVTKVLESCCCRCIFIFILCVCFCILRMHTACLDCQVFYA